MAVFLFEFKKEENKKMVKISFIASGIILGLATISSASASIISRSFLDEALTDYATNTALDLKANQSDLTALSNKIGTLPDGITLENFYKGWVDSGGESMAEYITKQQGVFYTYDPVNDDVRPERFPDVGYLDVLASLMDQEGFVPTENSVLAPFFYLTKQAMRVGEIPRNKTAADMINEINNKIGTLPEGITVQGMYEGWTDSKGVIHKGLNDLSTITNNIDLSVEGSIAALMGYESGHKTRVKAVLNQLFMPIPEYPNFYNLGWRILEGGAFPKFAQEKYGIPGYKGLVDLTKGVGDLPSGNFPLFPDYELLFPYLNQPYTYPTSLAELITAIYGNSETGAHGLLSAIIHGFPLNGSPDEYVGLVPNFYLAKYIKDIAEANTAKIGTLPSGNFREFPGYDLLFPWLNQPYTYPTSLAELITAIYGNSETGQMGLLEGIIAGFGIDTDGDGQFDSNIGTLSNYGLAKNAIDLANANATKIGDLPTEYATVGAALTAMKSDIDAKNLPSTSDDGQYVLSAKKVGDTITYTWVKMDLTNEEQAQ